MLYKWEAPYYPGAPLLNAFKREVAATGARVIEWDEPGGKMMIGISGPPTMLGYDRGTPGARLSQIVYAYGKAVKWYGTSGRTRPGFFERETALAVKDFEDRMREVSP